MPLDTCGQMRRHRRLFPQLAFRDRDLGKIHAEEHPTHAPTRRTAVPIPKARSHCGGGSGHIRQDITRSQRELWQAVTALGPKDKRPMRAEHLLGRQRDLLNRPASAIQTPQRRGRDRQVRRHHQRCSVTRVVDHHASKRRSPGCAVGRPRLVQRSARTLRPAAPHWAVAAEGVAAIVLPVYVRGKGRTISP